MFYELICLETVLLCMHFLLQKNNEAEGLKSLVPVQSFHEYTRRGSSGSYTHLHSKKDCSFRNAQTRTP